MFARKCNLPPPYRERVHSQTAPAVAAKPASDIGPRGSPGTAKAMSAVTQEQDDF
ncbi:MAG: hypothetical protein JWP72_2297 [Massilia sp.]|nr:hypothetical protein [Massilia sp.]MDB5790315.1 hypothetical protein [Massilia sp.]